MLSAPGNVFPLLGLCPCPHPPLGQLPKACPAHVPACPTPQRDGEPCKQNAGCVHAGVCPSSGAESPRRGCGEPQGTSVAVSPLISSKCARRRCQLCKGVYTIAPDPRRCETFNQYLLTSCQINYHHHTYFLLVSGESGHGKLKRQLRSFQRGCGRREGTEGPVALQWGVHVQRYSAGLCKPILPPRAGLVSQAVSAGSLLACKHLSCPAELVPVRGARAAVPTLPAQHGRALAQRSVPVRRDGQVGEERGKGTGKRVWAPGDQHKALPLQLRGQQ